MYKKFLLPVVSCAALTWLPSSEVLAEKAHASRADAAETIRRLEAENARLRKALADAEAERARLAGPSTSSAPAEADGRNPFAVKELERGHAEASKTVKAGTEMACGAHMQKSTGVEMACGAHLHKAGEPRVAANGSGVDVGIRSHQLQFNPILSGSDFYSVHPEGVWMFNYKFMHMEMGGLRDGTGDIRQKQAIGPGSRYGYQGAPTRMTMDMQMLMGMVGLTDRLTAMGMVNYQTSEMYMDMDFGTGPRPHAPMRTNGLGDTEVDLIYALNRYFYGTLGLGIPTGSVSQRVSMMNRDFRAPYGMQNGSGTVDFKPSLSYHDYSADEAWMWGSQATYTHHIGETDYGYARGDNFKLTTFLQRAFGPATGMLRLVYNNTGRIQGHDPKVDEMLAFASTPDADPDNYGGQRLDALLGLSYEKGAFSFGVEGGAPIFQDLNGLQMKTRWTLNAGFQAMF